MPFKAKFSTIALAMLENFNEEGRKKKHNKDN